MVDKLWKATERAIAARLGGQRIPITGRAGRDLRVTGFCVEVKERKEIAFWITAAIKQAVNDAEDNEIPLVVIHVKGQKHDNDLSMMRLCDLQMLCERDKDAQTNQQL